MTPPMAKALTHISQNEINSLALKACDTFLGVVDPSEYKNYVLVFLFINYLSDVYKDRLEAHKKKHKGDKQKIIRALSREWFAVPKNSSFDFIYEYSNESIVGEIINIALEAIEEKNKGKLDGVFMNIVNQMSLNHE
jgi:type I restriction enzyme M protein